MKRYGALQAIVTGRPCSYGAAMAAVRTHFNQKRHLTSKDSFNRDWFEFV